jgi:RNA polymerase sigma-70 factor (ECF subfamily)
VANFTRKSKGTAKSQVAREVPLDPDSDRGNVVGLVERLPDDYRQVLLWRYQERLSFEEMARRLGRSANAARKLWARAVERQEQEMGPRP